MGENGKSFQSRQFDRNLIMRWHFYVCLAKFVVNSIFVSIQWLHKFYSTLSRAHNFADEFRCQSDHCALQTGENFLKIQLFVPNKF